MLNDDDDDDNDDDDDDDDDAAVKVDKKLGFIITMIIGI